MWLGRDRQGTSVRSLGAQGVSRSAAIPLRLVTSWKLAAGYCLICGRRAELALLYIDVLSTSTVLGALEMPL